MHDIIILKIDSFSRVWLYFFRNKNFVSLHIYFYILDIKHQVNCYPISVSIRVKVDKQDSAKRDLNNSQQLAIHIIYLFIYISSL